jgi:hypothetical protein
MKSSTMVDVKNIFLAHWTINTVPHSNSLHIGELSKRQNWPCFNHGQWLQIYDLTLCHWNTRRQAPYQRGFVYELTPALPLTTIHFLSCQLSELEYILKNAIKVAEQLPNKGPSWNFYYTRIRNISSNHPTSKYPSRHVVSARGKFKLTETEKKSTYS